MSDLVSYYVESTFLPGPGVLYRRRPFPERSGTRSDEFFMARKDAWKASNGVRKYEAGFSDNDLYCVHPEEAEAVMSWLRRLADVGRDNAGPPPVLGEWRVGTAWLLQLAGPLSDEKIEAILQRLNMERRAYVSDPLEHDFGLRVLRTDMECRWNFELYRLSDSRWFLRLKYLRRGPDEQTVQGLRNQAFPLLAELGIEIVEERIAPAKSSPCSDRARAELRDGI